MKHRIAAFTGLIALAFGFFFLVKPSAPSELPKLGVITSPVVYPNLAPLLSSMSVHPLGGGSDDAPQIQAALNSLAGTGRALFLSGGTFNLLSAGIIPPSGSVIYGSPNTIINQQLTGVLGPSINQCGIHANVAVAAQGTVTASNTLGALTVSSSISIGVGNLVQLLTADGLHGSIYTVTAQSGSGPYTITVDRAVLYQFANNDLSWQLTSRPEQIQIHGGGMKMSGTGIRYIELPGCYRCLGEDINIDASLGAVTDQIVSFDIGGVENMWRRVHVDGNPANLDGIDLESNERSTIVDCSANGLRYGFGIYDGTDVELRGNTAYGNHAGIGLFGDLTTVGGSGVRIIGGSFFANTKVINTIPGSGIYIDRGSANQTPTLGTIIDGVDCKYNGYGIHVEGSTVPTRTKIANSTLTNNTQSGIQVTTGALGTMVSNCDVSSNGVTGIFAQAEMNISNLVATGASQPTVMNINSGTFDLTLDGFRFDGATNFSGAIVTGAGNQVSIANGFINLTSASADGIWVSGTGTSVKVSNTRITGGRYGAVVAGATGGTLRQGPGYDASGTGTAPVLVSANCYANRGTVTLNGTTGVDITWPNAKATDNLALTLHTAGGTLGSWKYTITAGTKFTVSSTNAADTSVLEYVVN